MQLWLSYIRVFMRTNGQLRCLSSPSSGVVSLCVTRLNNHSDICLVLCLLACWLIGSHLNNPVLARLHRISFSFFCASVLDFFFFLNIPSLTDELPPDHQTCEKTIATRLILLQASCICEQAGGVLCPATDGWACYAGWNENKREKKRGCSAQEIQPNTSALSCKIAKRNAKKDMGKSLTRFG